MSLDRRGLSSRWSVEPRDGEGSRQVRFTEMKDWEKDKDTTTPFARMEAKMREAAPPLVRRLARMEANKKPWTLHNYPVERVRERIVAFGKSIGFAPGDERIATISEESGNNLWDAFDQLRALVDSENLGR
jgi:hypothetical protein